MRKIDNWMTPFLGVANIHTYHDLNQCVHRLESNPPLGGPGTSGSKVKKVGKAESKATFTKAANTSTGTSSNAAPVVEVATRRTSPGEKFQQRIPFQN